MKKTVFITLLSVLAVTVTAENLGTDYYALGEYDNAKAYFEKNLATSPVESNFYLGEIAFAEGKIDAAKAYYEKGLTADPADFFNQIGLIKIALKADPKTADKQFKAIQKLSKKDIDVTIAIARAYLDNKMFAEANAKREEAYKKNKNYPQVYVLEGDILKVQVSKEQIGVAAAKYEMAITKDANYGLATIKFALAYININKDVAIESLRKLTTTRPDYYIAYRFLGELYVNYFGDYPKAIEAYNNFFKGDSYNIVDIARIVRAYYFSKDYSNAANWVKKGFAMDKNDFIMNRFNMYIDADLPNPVDGIAAAEKFFSLQPAQNTPRITLDYEKYATILTDLKRFNEAIAQYEKAIAADTIKDGSLYQKASDIAKKKNDYGLAAAYYTKYMEAANSNNAVEINRLLLLYYNAGTVSVKDNAVLAEQKNDAAMLTRITKAAAEKDSILADTTNQILKTKVVAYYLKKADAYTDSLIARLPESYTGYRWKAVVQQAIDLNKTNDATVAMKNGAAKPYYEKAIEKILAGEEQTEQQNKMLVEAYNYLAYYYYLTENNPSATEYCAKVLALDPNNLTAKQISDAIEKAVNAKKS